MAEQTLHSLREALPAIGLSTFREAGVLFSLATACPLLDTASPLRARGSLSWRPIRENTKKGIFSPQRHRGHRGVEFFRLPGDGGKRKAARSFAARP
jgi:hypothetical protein